MSDYTISTHVAYLIANLGGVRRAARAVNIDPAYLLRLRDGDKLNPSAATLRKLGLRKVISYVRIKKAKP